MARFDFVSGRVTELHRFINVPFRWWEEHPARERRELWIATPEGGEIKLVVHSRQMPARLGHHVDALLLDDRFVGLHNVTTGGSINFLQADPPLLWRRTNSAFLVLVMVSSFAAFLAGSDLGGLAGLLFVLVFPVATVIGRLARRARKKILVDSALKDLVGQMNHRPALVRVK